MTKILHISKFYPPYRGGIEDVCYSVVDILKSNPQYSQKVLCFNDKKETVTEMVDGVEVIRAGIKGIKKSQPISFRMYSILRRTINSFRPDYIHLHLPNPLTGLYVSMLIKKDCKLILHWHSDIVEQAKLYKLVKPFENRLLKRAYKIIATSPNYIDGSKPLMSVKEKTVVIPNIINEEKLKLTPNVEKTVQAIKEKYNGKPIVLFIGRHVQYKGIEFLIAATKHIPSECAIVIGGSGPLTEKLKKGTSDPRIHFIGRIPDEEMTAYYYAASVFAFPSITKNEAFGVALAEAMYCNTPAVTYTIEGSGVNWVNVKDQTGLEVENSSVEQLGGAIDTLLTDNILREKFALAARKRVETLFMKNSITESIFELYR